MGGVLIIELLMCHDVASWLGEDQIAWMAIETACAVKLDLHAYLQVADACLVSLCVYQCGL